MISAFHGIEVGKKGLIANNTALDTISHNLSNLDTEGYSRQKVNLKTFHPIYDPSLNHAEGPGQIGTGVVVEDIQRVRDTAIDDRVQYEKGSMGYWKSRQGILHQIEMLYNEPGKPTLRTMMDDHWESWQNVAENPTEKAARIELVERAKNLTQAFNHHYNSLNDLRENVDKLIDQRVNEINNYADQIANLNVQIAKSEALGDMPNDLYDRRDLMIENLSQIVNIRVERNNKNEMIVYIGAENLVQGGKVNQLQAIGNPDNNGYLDVFWADNRKVEFDGGELQGFLDARDKDLHGNITQLNSLAVNMADSINEIHRDGFGLNLQTDQDFFKYSQITPSQDGNYDFNNDGTPDGTALFKISGTESLSENTVIGSGGFMNFGPNRPNGTDVVISYNAKDTIKEVMDKINQSEAGVAVYLNHKGQLSFKAKVPNDERNPNFVIRHIEDSGNLLVGIAGVLGKSGAQNAFDYNNLNDITKLNVPSENISITPTKNPASWIAINPIIESNVDFIAAAGGYDSTGDGNPNVVNGKADNRSALLIAGIRHKKIMVENDTTIGDYFQTMIGDLGTRSESAKNNMDKNDAVVKSLENLRQQISGVNVDEELSKMIMFQHGYNASARLVNTFDKMLETLIRLGS